MMREETSNIKMRQAYGIWSKYAKNKEINDYCLMTTECLNFKQNDEGEPLSELSDFIEKNPRYRTIVCTEISRFTRLRDEFLILVDFLKKRKMQVYFTKSKSLLFDEKFNLNVVYKQKNKIGDLT